MRVIGVVLLIISLPVMVGAAEDHSQSASDVLAEILESQTISQVSNIDCQKITEEQFEELGDAVMEQRHPGEQHIVMDNMMGGEGSETLRSMHVMMGQNYLGCNTDKQFMNSGMMGGGISKNTFGMNNRFGMMGLFGTSSFSFSYLVTTLMLWTLLILGIVALIKWIKNKS